MSEMLSPNLGNERPVTFWDYYEDNKYIVVGLIIIIIVLLSIVVFLLNKQKKPEYPAYYNEEPPPRNLEQPPRREPVEPPKRERSTINTADDIDPSIEELEKFESIPKNRVSKSSLDIPDADTFTPVA